MKVHAMRWATVRGVRFAAGILLFSALPALAAPTAEQKCEAAKKAEAGKFAACRLKAESKLVFSGDTAKYDKALEKCAGKLADTFDKLEGGGACPTTGDAEAIVGFLSTCSDGVADSSEGGGTLPVCGDASVNVAGEECDGVALGGRTCASLGFSGGTLACGGSCTFDTSGCTTDGGSDCGNADIDPGEDCDQGNLNGTTCEDEGFVGGTLGCGAGCAYDTSGCWNQRYVDNADGTVTDNRTGLMWEKKVKLDAVTDPANLQDVDNQYNWSGRCSVTTSKYCQPDASSSAACLAGFEADPAGCSPCTGGDGVCNLIGPGVTIWQWLLQLNTAAFAGHDDWRIPTREELASLVDLLLLTPSVGTAFDGASCGAACTDVTDPACSCTANGFLWSAASWADDITSAWVVDFFDGSVPGGDGKQGDNRVRAVRSVH